MALFEKYGGREFWADAVEIFYQRMVTDPLLAPRFQNSDVNKVKAMNTHLLESALGDNDTPIAVSIRRVHEHMAVPKEAFNRFLTLFGEVLREKGVSEEDMGEIEDVLLAFEDDVVR